MVRIEDYIARFPSSPFARLSGPPWHLTASLPAMLEKMVLTLDADYLVARGCAVHRSAAIEDGAIVKGPAVIGPGCLVAATAYLRGGVYLEEGCTIGPAAELKTTVMFRGSKLAHLNFVGDSILGEDVNIEAGAMITNYRNELPDKEIRIRIDGEYLDTGVDKFGALVGDHVRLGANAVIAPGALIHSGQIVPRLALIDQSAPA